jgi:hypothetical protein
MLYTVLITASWSVDLLKYIVRHDGSMPESIAVEDIIYERSPLDEIYGHKNE